MMCNDLPRLISLLVRVTASGGAGRAQHPAGAAPGFRRLDAAGHRHGGGADGAGSQLPLHQEPAAVRGDAHAGHLHL